MAELIITVEHLREIARAKPTPLMRDLAAWVTATCPEFGIDTPAEMAHFLAQACHETDGFRTLKEYASGVAYEGRKDLGNVYPGDGARFRGRGILQTTGRANYAALGHKFGDARRFVEEPQLLETPELAVWSACVFWDGRNLNDAANHPDTDKLTRKLRGKVCQLSPLEYITSVVNGGFNGLEARLKAYNRAKEVLA